MSNDDRDKLIKTYLQLRIEEGTEIFTAIDAGDKVEFLDGLIDLLVVTSFELHLINDSCLSDWNFNTTGNGVQWLLLGVKYHLETEDILHILGVLYNTIEVLTQIDVDIDKAIDEVLKSNMSKFPLGGDVSIQEELDRLEDSVRYSDITYDIVLDNDEQERLVFWAWNVDGVKLEKPKYVKPSSFVEPDFASCWNV
jgi:hypothetical protein